MLRSARLTSRQLLAVAPILILGGLASLAAGRALGEQAHATSMPPGNAIVANASADGATLVARTRPVAHPAPAPAQTTAPVTTPVHYIKSAPPPHHKGDDGGPGGHHGGGGHGHGHD